MIRDTAVQATASVPGRSIGGRLAAATAAALLLLLLPAAGSALAKEKATGKTAAMAKPASAKSTKPSKPSKATPPEPTSCYTKEEFEAEQAMRLHTELMVVGLQCRDMLRDQNPYAKYHAFTAKHGKLLAKWEQVLIDHYRRTGKGNATRQFDTYRTEMANQFSRRASIITTPAYCQMQAQGLANVGSLSDDDIKELVSQDMVFRISGRPPCQPISTPKPASESTAALPDAPGDAVR